MKDYSQNSFEKKSFILKYDIDALESTILVYYADGTTQLLPYTITQEKILLKKMKEQILKANKYNLKNTLRLQKYLIFDLGIKAYFLTNIMFIIMSLFSNPILGLYNSLALFLFTIGISKPYKNNRKKMNDLVELINDYQKNLNFINNEDSFSNKKIFTREVITKASSRVSHIINNGIIVDEKERYMELLHKNEEPYVSHIVSKEDNIINEYMNDGFIDYGKREVPFINVNTAEMLSEKELEELKDLTKNSNNKVKVLSKITN